ncbi:MAG: sporulation integral membrane protein YlbJ [Clostridiaceae bacterium]|nr:sporulation integral membrane protein YlbJ [Clostridiaceae bacterium]
MIFSAVLVIAVFVLILLAVKPSKIVYIKSLSIPALCLLFVICIVIFSDSAVRSALDGLVLWSSIVVPSLFPFFVASELMNSTGFTRAAGMLLEPVMRPFFNVPGCASFALALGVTSGYPVGAKITADMRKNGSLSKYEAERLLAFTNNSGPLFIIGAVGTGMFGSAAVGLFLFVCHLLSCITVGFLFRYYKWRRPGDRDRNASLKAAGTKGIKLSKNAFVKIERLLTEQSSKKKSFGELLGTAIKNSVSTILVIGGFIVLFSVIISLLNETGLIGMISEVIADLIEPLFPGVRLKELISGVLGGFFEITAGSRLVSRALSVPLTLKLPAVSLLIGWAGLSVHFQVMSIVSETDIDVRPYLGGKSLQGVLASVYTFLGGRFINIASPANEAVLGTAPLNFHGFFTSLGNSVLILILVMIVCFFISRHVKSPSGGKSQKKRSSI